MICIAGELKGNPSVASDFQLFFGFCFFICWHTSLNAELPLRRERKKQKKKTNQIHNTYIFIIRQVTTTTQCTINNSMCIRSRLWVYVNIKCCVCAVHAHYERLHFVWICQRFSSKVTPEIIDIFNNNNHKKKKLKKRKQKHNIQCHHFFGIQTNRQR